VDDIIMLYHPHYQDEFEKLEQQLVKLYNLRQLGSVNQGLIHDEIDASFFARAVDTLPASWASGILAWHTI
jgi:hypothetical protein